MSPFLLSGAKGLTLGVPREIGPGGWIESRSTLGPLPTIRALDRRRPIRSTAARRGRSIRVDGLAEGLHPD